MELLAEGSKACSILYSLSVRIAEKRWKSAFSLTAQRTVSPQQGNGSESDDVSMSEVCSFRTARRNPTEQTRHKASVPVVRDIKKKRTSQAVSDLSPQILCKKSDQLNNYCK